MTTKIAYQKVKKEKPWILTYWAIKTRCENPKFKQYKDYGGKGVKCLITQAELKELWLRDNAGSMIKPSIDREESEGNYTYKNCKFTELSKNIAERNRRVDSKKVLQYSLSGKLIRFWNSTREIERELGFNHSSISQACRGIYKQTNGFIWQYA